MGRVRRRFGSMLVALGILLLAYVVWCSFLYLMQDTIFFPGTRIVQPVSAPPFGTHSERITHPDRVTTELWISGAKAAKHGSSPLLIHLHGNGERIDHQQEILTLAAEAGYVAVLPEYRGYGRSGGQPSQRAVTEDLVRVVDQMTSRPELDDRRIVYWGRSIGASFAAELAQRRPPAALILQTPFARMDLSAWRYFAPSWLVRHPFRSDLALRRFARPVLIVKHTHDSVAPPEHAELLHRLLPQSALLEIDADHNDSGRPEEAARERAAIVELLQRIAQQQP